MRTSRLVRTKVTPYSLVDWYHHYGHVERDTTVTKGTEEQDRNEGMDWDRRQSTGDIGIAVPQGSLT
jgi:hypothetical protein